jgi:hypothetical protein
MSVPHQPADDVAAHPSETDHAELHVVFPASASDHVKVLLQCFGSEWWAGEGWGEGLRSIVSP